MNKLNVMRFEKNKWLEVSAMELMDADLIYLKNNLLKVTGKPTVISGKVNLPACIYKHSNSEVIVLAIGSEWNNRQAISKVMDHTNSGCLDFEDGTYMIAELDEGPGAIYSPRLPISELEKWCNDNLKKFEQFYTKNELFIETGKIVKMDVWW